jgi:hypothetical protein
MSASLADAGQEARLTMRRVAVQDSGRHDRGEEGSLGRCLA